MDGKVLARSFWPIPRAHIARSDAPNSRRGSRLSIPPEILEPIRGQLRITDCVLDVAVPEVGLQRPGVDAGLGQFEAAGVAQRQGWAFERSQFVTLTCASWAATLRLAQGLVMSDTPIRRKPQPKLDRVLAAHERRARIIAQLHEQAIAAASDFAPPLMRPNREQTLDARRQSAMSNPNVWC